MTFKQAIQSGFQNYVTFSGRAARSEYWYWTLFVFLSAFVLAIVDSALGTPFYAIFALGVFLPNLAVLVRRLHDRNKSGWWILLFLIPLIGAVILLIWTLLPSDNGANDYGVEPV